MSLMPGWDNPLRQVGDGGPGFCYLAAPEVFAGADDELDGPLLLGLDSNVMFDIERYGGRMIDEGDFEDFEEHLRVELVAEQRILELWMMRDIRFVVLPGIRGDFKRRPSDERLQARETWFSAVEQSIFFQMADWDTATEDVDRGRFETFKKEELVSVPGDLDRMMLESAWRRGVDVFLTRDAQLIGRAPRSPGWPRVWGPSTLDRHLRDVGMDDPFQGGFVDHAGCIWRHGFPMGDTGKWVPLLQSLEDSR